MFKKLMSAVAAAACVFRWPPAVQRLPVKLPLKQPPPRPQLLPKPRPKRLPALKLLTVPCALPA